MDKSRVSVIMPCYNAGPYVRTAIESVLDQDINARVIAVDDGSTDNTLEVLESFGGAITLLHADHQGVAHARNQAIGYTDSDYTLLLDADDALAPGALAQLLRITDQDNNCVAYGSFSSWDKTMTRRLQLHKATRLGTNPLSMLVTRNISPPGAILFPTTAFDRVGDFDQEVAGCEDWDFIIRLMRAGYHFRRLDEEVFYYRRVPFSASNQARKMLKSGLEVIRRSHNRDMRIQGDSYADGHPDEFLQSNLFNYHAYCLAIAALSEDMEDCRHVLRNVQIPKKPDWRGFGSIFRHSIWWNSLVAEGNSEDAKRRSQVKCVKTIAEIAAEQTWGDDMITHILFPDFRQLLARPGPKKAFRLIDDWMFARQTYRDLDI